MWPTRGVNEYVATLTSDGAPLLGKTVVLWYAAGGDPGWELYNRGTIVECMALGGKTIAAVTDERGRARISLPEMEAAAKTHGVHYGYEMAMVCRQRPNLKQVNARHEYGGWTKSPCDSRDDWGHYSEAANL